VARIPKRATRGLVWPLVVVVMLMRMPDVDESLFCSRARRRFSRDPAARAAGAAGADCWNPSGRMGVSGCQHRLCVPFVWRSVRLLCVDVVDINTGGRRTDGRTIKVRCRLRAAVGLDGLEPSSFGPLRTPAGWAHCSRRCRWLRGPNVRPDRNARRRQAIIGTHHPTLRHGRSPCAAHSLCAFAAIDKERRHRQRTPINASDSSPTRG